MLTFISCDNTGCCICLPCSFVARGVKTQFLHFSDIYYCSPVVLQLNLLHGLSLARSKVTLYPWCYDSTFPAKNSGCIAMFKDEIKHSL